MNDNVFCQLLASLFSSMYSYTHAHIYKCTLTSMNVKAEWKTLTAKYTLAGANIHVYTNIQMHKYILTSTHRVGLKCTQFIVMYCKFRKKGYVLLRIKNIK